MGQDLAKSVKAKGKTKYDLNDGVLLNAAKIDANASLKRQKEQE